MYWVAFILLFYIIIIMMCYHMVSSKVKGAVFLLVFWSLIVLARLLYWADVFIYIYGSNPDLSVMTDNKYYTMIMSIALSFTLIMWLFNIQKMKKIKIADTEEQE